MRRRIAGESPAAANIASRHTSRRLSTVIGSSRRSTRRTSEVIFALHGASMPICAP
jgi:CRP-like cAMP-binding protein